MTVRPCLASDLPVEGAPWLVPQAEVTGTGCSLVEEHDGRVVAAGLRRPSRLHGTMDGAELHCEEGHGVEVLRALADAGTDRPMVLRVVPGTTKAAAVAELDRGEVVQSLPPAAVPSGQPDVQEWARERIETALQAGVEVCPATSYEPEVLADLWFGPYLPMHEHWSPVTDLEALRGYSVQMVEMMDKDASFVASVDGRPVAVTFMEGEFDGICVPALNVVEPEHPVVEAAAAASMAATLHAVSPRPVEFEGHADEPLYMRVLESIPQRSAGALTPMHLVRL